MTKLNVETILYAETGNEKYHLKRLGDDGAITLEITSYNFVDDTEDTRTYEFVEAKDIQLALDVVRNICEGIALVKQREHDEGIVNAEL